MGRASLGPGLVLTALLLGACGSPRAAPASAPAASSASAVAAPAPPPILASADDVPTYHGDLLRMGWQRAETVLTPATVSAGLGRLWTSPDLGGAVYGQPLYVAQVEVGAARHDVVVVGTEADTLWALDAATGAVLWGPVRVGTPVPRSDLVCGDINPVGITGTPVADPAHDALYAVAMTATPSGPAYELVGLALATGRALPGFPVALAPRAPGAPVFDPRVQEQRGALTLLPGGRVLDVPFGGFDGDCGAYHGWVTQVWLPRPTDQASFVTPTRREGGLWGAAGLAYGPEGALFGVTGNSSGASATDMGDAVLRLLPAPHLHQPAGPAGFFAPSNAVALDVADRDVGTAGPLLLPPQPGPYPYLLFTMGKQGVGYLVDRWDPGGVGTGNGITGEGVWSGCLYGTCGPSAPPASFSAAAYFAAANGAQYVVTAGITAQAGTCSGRGGLEAWTVHTGPALSGPWLGLAWCGPSMVDPGSPTISSDGAAGPVVWILDAGTDRLLAVDAADGSPLWQGAVPPIERFTVPTVAGGRVFVPTTTGVVALGPGGRPG